MRSQELTSDKCKKNSFAVKNLAVSQMESGYFFPQYSINL